MGMNHSGHKERASRSVCAMALAALAPALLWAPNSSAQGGAAATPAQPAQSPGPAAVAGRADELLREVGAYLGSADQFTFHAQITFDHVLPSGQKLQYSASEDVALRR